MIYMSNVDTLHKQGYFIIRANDKENRKVGLACINQDNTINYKKLNLFIHEKLIPNINNEVPIFNNPSIGKFRFSNNTNSVDASTFHGDIYNHRAVNLMPIYTCLIYFDNAQMEIIPGTHIKGADNSPITQFSKKKIITMNPGDMLVFHANIHHRGIGFTNNKNRRLLQVFNIFPNQETYTEHNPKLFTFKSSKSFITLLLPITKILATYKPIINFINFIHYILVCYNIQYKITLTDISPQQKQDKYITYEPIKSIPLNKTNGRDEWNINIVYDENYNTVSPSNYYLKYLLILLVIVIIVFFLIKNLLKTQHRRRRPKR